MTKNTITLRNETTVKANGTHVGGSCKPVVKIDKFGKLTVYTSGVDAAKANNLYTSDLSKVIHSGKLYKGNKYCFVEQLHNNLDYITSKHNMSTEQEARIAELEAKAKAYDAYIKAKQQRERDIADVTETLAHARQARIDLEFRLHEMQEREIALELQLENLKTNEVVLE